MTRLLSVKAARAITTAAEIVKAPDWSDTRTWHAVSGSQILVIIEPSYSGTSRTGRTGWLWWLANGGRARHPAEPTIKAAATAGLLAWGRAATAKERQ